MIEIQLWHLVSLLLAFFSCIAGFWKFTESRREKTEDQRWNDLHRHLDARFKVLSDAQQEERKKFADIERAMLELKAELPEKYLMKADYVQMQSSILTKLDALAVRFQNAMLRAEVEK